MTWRTSYSRGLALAVGVAGYAMITTFLLANTATAYGFRVRPALPEIIDVGLQLCPLVAALVMLLISPAQEAMADTLASRFGKTLTPTLANIAVAVLLTVTTIVEVLFVSAGLPRGLGLATLFYVSLAFCFDLVLIGVFTRFLYVLTRRWWLALLLFIGYMAMVVIVGPTFGITSYIGFASTPPTPLTAYSDMPVHYQAAWLFRIYWALIAGVMLSVMRGYSSSPTPLLTSLRLFPVVRMPKTLALAALAAFLFGGFLFIKTRSAGDSAEAPRARSAALVDGRYEFRPKLSHFNLHLRYAPDEQSVLVEGTLVFVNESGSSPLNKMVFEAPGLVGIEQLQLDGLGKYEIHRSGQWLRVTMDTPVAAGAAFQLRYSGAIRRSGWFGEDHIGAKLLKNAFFVNGPDVLFAARRSACPSDQGSERPRGAGAVACPGDENYLLTDAATGEISVVAPKALEVITIGREVTQDLEGNLSEHKFEIETPRLAAFMIACAPFRKTVVPSVSGENAVSLYQASSSNIENDRIAAVAQSILSYYEKLWTRLPNRDFRIVVVPSALGEAVSYEGMVAINENLIASREAASQGTSSFLEFVLAHEIAHQWWGYRIVPARTPGRLFVLESFAQFAAYKYLSHRGLLQEDEALNDENRNYRVARAHSHTPEIPLMQLETERELAYHKGPAALLYLDSITDHGLMNVMGSVTRKYGNQQPVPADTLISSAIALLPEHNRVFAKSLLFDVETLSATLENVKEAGSASLQPASQR